jgi:DNA-binding MarR family transcriptional regulator
MKRTEDIGMLLKQINDTLAAEANNELRSNGMTISQIRFIGYMYESGEERTAMKELEKQFQVSQPTVAGIVSRMEKKGLVRILQNPEDARAKDVTLTALGKSVYEAGGKHKEKMEKSLVSGLSGQEIRELKRMLKIILASLK